MQQQVHVVSQPNTTTGQGRPRFAKDTQHACGLLQLLLGLMVFFMGIPYIVWRGGGGLWVAGCNIWTAFFMIMQGALAISSVKSEDSGTIVGCMIMSIFSSFSGFTLFIMGIMGCIFDAIGGIYYPSPVQRHSTLAIGALSCIIGFTAFVIGIVQGAVCCRTTCCAGGGDRNAPTVVFIQQPHGHVQQPPGLVQQPPGLVQQPPGYVQQPAPPGMQTQMVYSHQY